MGEGGVERNTLETFANIFNCRLMSIPFMYLGMLMGANPRRLEVWEPVLKKIDKRLAKWKNKIISLAGRVCLINSILTSIPLFFLSFFKMPIGIHKKIIKKQREFLWGSGEDGGKRYVG